MVKLRIFLSILFLITSLNVVSKSVSYCGIEDSDFGKTLLRAKEVYLGKIKVENGKVFIFVEKSWKVNGLKKIEIAEPNRWTGFRSTDEKLVFLREDDGKEIIIAHSGISLNPLNLSQRCVVVHALLEDDYLKNHYKKILTKVLGDPAK